jgi:hypothetical protein
VATARATGSQTFVHVNYGTGTPAEAAAWVRYARQKDDHVARWAVGEEVWGNGGIDGIDFEPDAHADKSPQAYAKNALKFIAAMKKADPSVQVGVELLGVPGGVYQQAPWPSWCRTTTRPRPPPSGSRCRATTRCRPCSTAAPTPRRTRSPCRRRCRPIR